MPISAVIKWLRHTRTCTHTHAIGSELRKLYEDYLRGVSKNFDIDIACSRLQSEVDAMRSALEEAHQEQEQQEAAQGAGAQGEGQEGAQQEGTQQEGGEQQGGGAQAREQAVAAGEQQVRAMCSWYSHPLHESTSSRWWFSGATANRGGGDGGPWHCFTSLCCFPSPS